MTGILDGITSRFPPKRPRHAATPPPDRTQTPGSISSPPPPRNAGGSNPTAATATAEERYRVWRVPELGETLVVVVFDTEARAEVKKRFDGHALWFASELIYFMSKCSRWNAEKATFVLNDDVEAELSEFRELFVATCVAKSLFGASLVKQPEN